MTWGGASQQNLPLFLLRWYWPAPRVASACPWTKRACDLSNFFLTCLRGSTGPTQGPTLFHLPASQDSPSSYMWGTELLLTVLVPDGPEKPLMWSPHGLRWERERTSLYPICGKQCKAFGRASAQEKQLVDFGIRSLLSCSGRIHLVLSFSTGHIHLTHSSSLAGSKDSRFCVWTPWSVWP